MIRFRYSQTSFKLTSRRQVTKLKYQKYIEQKKWRHRRAQPCTSREASAITCTHCNSDCQSSSASSEQQTLSATRSQELVLKVGLKAIRKIIVEFVFLFVSVNYFVQFSIKDFLNTFSRLDILHKSQIGFLALRTLIDKYVSCHQTKVYACFVDFGKAFDSGMMYIYTSCYKSMSAETSVM